MSIYQPLPPRPPAQRHLICLAGLVVGLLMIVAAFTPPLNPPQCPAHATRMADGSTCIIGANIGAGLLWLAGIFVACVGGLALLISLASSWWARR